MSIFPINRGGRGRTNPLSLFTGVRRFLYITPPGSGRFLTGLFFCALFSGVLAVSPVISHAESSPAALPATTQATQPKTQIVTDQERGTVTIVIDGKPVLQVDKDGLRVVGDIVYGGTITDTDSAYVEKAIAGGGDDAE